MGKYTNADGSTVSFTDGDVIQDVADLYSLLEEDYNETPSAISVQLKGMLATLQAGAPLTGSQWTELAAIEKAYSAKLAAWRKTPDNLQQGFVPEAEPGAGRTQNPNDKSGSGRLHEAGGPPPRLRGASRAQLAMKPPQHCANCCLANNPVCVKYGDWKVTPEQVCDGWEYAAAGASVPSAAVISEAGVPREDVGKFMSPTSRIYDPKLLRGDRMHAAAAATDLQQGGRIRVAGHGDESQAAAADIIRRITDMQTVTSPMSVEGNQYLQLKTVKEAAARVGWRVREGAESPEPDPADVDNGVRKQTVCIDFDGVLHQGPHGLPGAPGGVLQQGSQQALKAMSEHYKLIVLTARNDLNAVGAWLDAQGVGQYITKVTNVKPPAVAYVDDRAVGFDGNWSPVLDSVDPEKIVTTSQKTKPVPNSKLGESFKGDSGVYKEGLADKAAGRPMQSAAAFKLKHPGADADDYPFYQAGFNADTDDVKLVPGKMGEAAGGAPSTTKLDKQLSAAHLHDSVLHDLAHAAQHLKRLADPDVKADEQSEAFNYQHALTHVESAQDHATRLGTNLESDPTDPKVFKLERAKLNAMREAVPFLPPSVSGRIAGRR